MEKARYKRKVVLNNSKQTSENENNTIQKKMKNVLPVKKKSIRKRQKSKIATLKTYVDLKIQERKEYLEGDMTALRARQDQLRRPNSMEGRRVKAPPTKDLAIATKQLSSMIRTGLPLLESLKIISETSEHTSIKYVFREIAIGISKGSTMTEMLDKYPEVFNEMYRALVSAGETAGLLPDTLDREAKLLESLSKIKGQIQSAMAYPVAIATLTVVVVFIMMIFVIPIFVDIYEESGATLPAITKILVDLSNQLKSTQFYFKAVPTGLALYLFYRYFSNKPYVMWWYDKALLQFPLTKDLVTKSCLANFSRTLSSLNSAGVPILESLSIAKRTVTNRVFMRIIDKMYKDIQTGNPIYRVLDQEQVIPIMFTSMFRIGEETGELSQMITKLAEFYEDEVSDSVKALTSIMEPLMIVFVAVFVGLILIAMYLPMFSMMQTVG
ncbi:type II secretion system F family protein [Prochlorococcus sp. MIT 1307]|uniref:type II secretion system F family protein n=1 Tax=Prochlorococcus sp. MIT 1307 TaxID=3096219 RepID=UPI002A74C137|nr:type II secretion system F family protein [Prochlorococcus sp. MIT 1307]